MLLYWPLLGLGILVLLLVPGLVQRYRAPYESSEYYEIYVFDKVFNGVAVIVLPLFALSCFSNAFGCTIPQLFRTIVQ